MNNNTSGFLAIRVGEVSPLGNLPVNELVVAMTLQYAVPVVIVSLPDVTQEDILNITAPLEAVGLWQNAIVPAGVLQLVLKVSETEVWAICVPFLDSEPVMRAWATPGGDNEANGSLVVLVDAGTGIVRAQRTIGLPTRLLEMVQLGIRNAPVIDQDAAIAEISAMSDAEMWAGATQWRPRLDRPGHGGAAALRSTITSTERRALRHRPAARYRLAYHRPGLPAVPGAPS